MSAAKAFAGAFVLAVMSVPQSHRPPAQPPIQPQPAAQAGLDSMAIVGYADHMSVQPGETIKFMVSSGAPRYRADIVRIVHGDINPRGIAPTRHDPLVSAPPAVGAQGVLTKWAGADSAGYGLFIDEEEKLALWLGSKGRSVEKVHAEPALRPWVPMIPGAARFPRPSPTTLRRAPGGHAPRLD